MEPTKDPQSATLHCPKCGKAVTAPAGGFTIGLEITCGCGNVVRVTRGGHLELKRGDLTATVGGFTDVSPLSTHPAHERTAAEEAGQTDWDRVADMPEFKALLKAKARFIVPSTLFFCVYYFALPVLVGWWPEFMKQKVFGPVNLAYLFASSMRSIRGDARR